MIRLRARHLTYAQFQRLITLLSQKLRGNEPALMYLSTLGPVLADGDWDVSYCEFEIEPSPLDRKKLDLLILILQGENIPVTMKEEFYE